MHSTFCCILRFTSPVLLYLYQSRWVLGHWPQKEQEMQPSGSARLLRGDARGGGGWAAPRAGANSRAPRLSPGVLWGVWRWLAWVVWRRPGGGPGEAAATFGHAQARLSGHLSVCLHVCLHVCLSASVGQAEQMYCCLYHVLLLDCVKHTVTTPPPLLVWHYLYFPAGEHLPGRRQRAAATVPARLPRLAAARSFSPTAWQQWQRQWQRQVLCTWPRAELSVAVFLILCLVAIVSVFLWIWMSVWLLVGLHFWRCVCVCFCVYVCVHSSLCGSLSTCLTACFPVHLHMLRYTRACTCLPAPAPTVCQTAYFCAWLPAYLLALFLSGWLLECIAEDLGVSTCVSTCVLSTLLACLCFLPDCLLLSDRMSAYVSMPSTADSNVDPSVLSLYVNPLACFSVRGFTSLLLAWLTVWLYNG